MRRWLLFNNDFGTCTRLAQQPIHGTRRTAYFISVKNLNGTKYVEPTTPADKTGDPMIPKANGVAPLIPREPASFPTPDGSTNMDQYLDYLYDNYFQILERDNLDPTSPANWKFTWYNQYYFFGIHQSILSTSPYLEQTKDWPGLTGGMGTFDPLK